ncbi:MAG: glucose-6-phosphate isomerase [Ruminococcaceae bacterium]|nr:glucose-6-phosphate isomerase [Oscillospiraceae bacterium]
MSLKLNDKYVSSFIASHEISQMQSQVTAADKMLREKSGPGNAFLGWLDLPENYDKAEFERVKVAAEKIKNTCDVLIVIGIGGSYLGARAVIEFLKSPYYNQLPKNTPDIYFAGNVISADALNEVLALCEGRDVCVNVISKSGTTTEPAIAFRVFRKLLENKYGKDGARERIFVTTDKARGTLKQFSTDEGYQTFVIPDDVGGRFSVLTSCGLLPIAVAGIDIDQMMDGARAAYKAYQTADVEKNPCYRYAAIRNILYRKGKSVEVLASYEPFMALFSEWWKQLYGESEGKDQRGIFPASVVFSTDLHSLGQYIQDGSRMLFETVIDLADTGASFEIPNDPANIDSLNFLSGMDLNMVKKRAMEGTILAHVDGGVPNIVLEVSERSAFALGELIYFFELACAISGYLLGVNPFDQPGVESYKKNMFALLGKPGYDDLRSSLEERLKNS